MRVYFDCNVILDWVLHRPPFFEQARLLISLLEQQVIFGYVSPLVLANVHFIISRQFSKKMADDFIYDFDEIFIYMDNPASSLKQCVGHGFSDYEDSIHAFSAIENDIKTIVSRDGKGFVNHNLNVMTPSELLNELGY